MRDDRLSTWLLGRASGARDGAMRGLLSALWSFLQHPAATFGEHLTSVEERLRLLEERLVGDLKSAVDTGVVAVEESVEGAEHRLEDDFKGAMRGRIAGIQARLEAVKTRVVEDLKHELRRVVMILATGIACAMLALLGMVFALMAAWTDLRGVVGPVGASLALAVAFLLASLIVFALLRSVLHRSSTPPGARKTAEA
jgi:hypothetical protein